MEDILQQLEAQMQIDIESRDIATKDLQDLQKPFGNFVLKKAVFVAREMDSTKLVKKMEEMVEVHEAEEVFSRRVDQFILEKGMPPIPWARCTFFLTFLFTLTTCLAHFNKADFVNLTVCSLAIYLLLNADNVKKSSFRMLVGGTILSIAYDLLWFYLRSNDMASTASSDGDSSEATVRHFALYVSYF